MARTRRWKHDAPAVLSGAAGAAALASFAIGAADPAADAVISAIWRVKTGKAGKLLDRARSVIKEIGRTYGPPLMETFKRHTQGQVVFSHAVVPRADEQMLGERIARVLAYSSEPLLAGDIARELESPGNLKDRTRLVRAELQSCEAFADVTRGRWLLGKPSGYEPAPLSPIEVADYTMRLHKDTRVWGKEGRR
jgi:hypothetical protein